MQSAIAICNVALTTYLRTKRITSFEEPSPEGEQCNLHYDQVRRSLLQRWPWYWATRREALVEMTLNDRAGAWRYRYARPAHLINVQWVNTAEGARAAMRLGRSADTPREMTADSIYSDTPDAVIEYTRDETDTTLFPPAFSNALAAALAAAMAMPITGDMPKRKDAEQSATLLLDQAMAMDFNSRPATEIRMVPPQFAARGLS